MPYLALLRFWSQVPYSCIRLGPKTKDNKVVLFAKCIVCILLYVILICVFSKATRVVDA